MNPARPSGHRFLWRPLSFHDLIRRMKAKLALIFLILLTANLSFGQVLVERLFVTRAETTTVDPYSGMTHTCLLVYPDGRYRLEKSFQGMGGGSAETKVYQDTLPEADLKAWLAVIDDAQFQAIKTAPPHGGIVQDMDTLYVTVPREHAVQNINFNNAAERKPFDKALKPFLNSLKNIEKRKVPVAKGEASNNCAAPQIIYRSTGMPGSMPDSN